VKIRIDQLDTHLQKNLASIYLVSGDEPLQRQECVDAIRRAGQTRGYLEREILDGESGMDWGRVSMAARERSLFGDQRILDLRLSQKPDREGQTLLTRISAELSEDILLIIQLPKLTGKEQQAAWFQKLEAKGVFIQVWPLEGDRLIRWLDQRMNSQGLLADQSGLRLLAARVEGNLLAAAQEIEKLRILHGSGQVTDAMILASVADSARFDVFDLAEEILTGRLTRIRRILSGLKNEGIAPQVALWSITRELRLANRLKREMAEGKSFETLANTHRLWDRHKNAMQMALNRLTLPLIRDALVRAATIDRIGKGLAPGDAWDALWILCVLIATGNTPTKSLASH
jgi:DNA polymerase III subunit delta